MEPISEQISQLLFNCLSDNQKKELSQLAGQKYKITKGNILSFPDSPNPMDAIKIEITLTPGQLNN